MRRGHILIRPIAVSVGFDHFKTDLNTIEATKRETKLEEIEESGEENNEPLPPMEDPELVNTPNTNSND